MLLMDDFRTPHIILKPVAKMHLVINMCTFSIMSAPSKYSSIIHLVTTVGLVYANLAHLL